MASAGDGGGVDAEGTAGGPASESRAPRLAGAALAEAAETAGGALAGWVTGLVRSGAFRASPSLSYTRPC